MEPYAPDDAKLRALLEETKTIAVVGLSANPWRDSHRVASYLQDRGYRIIPVNPREDEVLGETSCGSLSDVPDPIDMVDVFRRPEHTPEIAEEAVKVGAKSLWLQLDIVNDDARRIAEAGGLDVVMGLCIKVEHRRLM
jgi:predicted CoA-binding protein